jgi:hypothetical protein
MKSRNRRFWIWGLIAIAVIVGLTLVSAPASNPKNAGSTYSRAPDGYGAWYTEIEQQQVPVQRWQKPFEALVSQKSKPVTLLQVYSQLEPAWFSPEEEKWVTQGNTLVRLGVWQRVTNAAFSTQHQSPAGIVKIETKRRHQPQETPTRSQEKTLSQRRSESLLADDFGAIVWQYQFGKGRLILAATPYLAANAYQDEPGNYQFLVNLLKQNQQPIFVDEYIHGYKDSETLKQESTSNIFSYLAQTPVIVALVQIAIFLLVLTWAKNQRFGQLKPVKVPVVDNSEAYIQASAGVLQKAQCHEFVLDVLGKEQQLQLQKALGLGTVPVDQSTLISAWVQQTGKPAADLEKLFKFPKKKGRLNDQQLLKWLQQWQSVRRREP